MFDITPAQTTTQAKQVLNCLMLEMYDRTLLIPSSAVAEVINMLEVTPRAKMPAWYLGEVSWRDLPVPLICFETLSSGTQVEEPVKPRILVLNAMSGIPDFHFLALRLNSIPSPLKAEADALKSAGEPLQPFEVDSVYIGDELYKLPDLLAIEKQLERIGLI